MNPDPLHLWINNVPDGDLVVAHSPQEATRIVMDACGVDEDDAGADGWTRLPDDGVLLDGDERVSYQELIARGPHYVAAVEAAATITATTEGL